MTWFMTLKTSRGTVYPRPAGAALTRIDVAEKVPSPVPLRVILPDTIPLIFPFTFWNEKSRASAH